MIQKIIYVAVGATIVGGITWYTFNKPVDGLFTKNDDKNVSSTGALYTNELSISDLDKNAQYELRVTTDYTWNDGRFSVKAEGTVPLSYNASLPSKGTLQETEVIMSNLPCKTASSSPRVLKLSTGKKTPFSVLLDIGEKKFEQFDCKSGAISWSEGETDPWSDMFEDFHAKERTNGRTYELRNWEKIEEGNVVARKIYDVTSRSGDTEKTTLLIVKVK